MFDESSAGLGTAKSDQASRGRRNVSEQIIGLGYEVVQFLLVVVWIAGLVVCIVYQHVSRSMILLIVGFAGELLASLLP